MDQANQQASSITMDCATTVNTNGGVQPKLAWTRKYMKWIHVSIYGFFLLAGQTIGTLLGRSYFNNGGNSKWMATLVQLVGFPVLIPLLFTSPSNFRGVGESIAETASTKPKASTLAWIYTALGILVAINCMFYSIGLQYLSVSTYSLICASQLGFNAIFSVFINKEKLTPYVLNSAVLLTMSSVVLVIQHDHEETGKISKKKYIFGFVSTVFASAGYALILSLTQLAFQKVIKSQTFMVVVEMSIYQSVVATAVILIGFFASGEWKSMHREEEGFIGGKGYYVNNLFWTAVSWQVFGIGCIGLIFKVSSLFSNAISVVGLPIAPALAVVFFHDKMTGAKIVSLLLAIWGFLSYFYQNYLDDLKAREEAKLSSEKFSVNGNGSVEIA